ncbi:MAG: hypothetical protein JRF63_03765 [Deltaproteobacteria bacterium]|nr:hypothetical protein [Deltaproteobacteria bacterium]
MIRISIVIVALILAVSACSEQLPEPPVNPVARYTSKATDGEIRFAPVEIVLEVDEPVAAYQVELLVKRGQATVVGVEGGENAGFDAAPYYDPAALKGGRIVIGAFSTKHVLTRGRHRVAAVHMREVGPDPAEYELRLVAAASASGERTATRPVLGPWKGASR